jgi:hypothetical protein
VHTSLRAVQFTEEDDEGAARAVEGLVQGDPAAPVAMAHTCAADSTVPK